MKFFDYIVAGIILLNITNTYTLLSGFTGISFQVYGAIFLLLLSFYVFQGFGVIEMLLRKNPFKFFIFLFTIYPLLSSLYAPLFQLRFVSYIMMSLLLFLGTALFINKFGYRYFYKIIFISWVIGCFGIVLSYFFPSIFHSVANLQAISSGHANSWSEVNIAHRAQGRAFGFYMQSNRACLAILSHLLIIVPVYLYDRPYKKIFVMCVSFIVILLTGSRGGFIMFFVFTLFIVSSELYLGLRVKGKILDFSIMVHRYFLLIGLGMASLFFTLCVTNMYTQEGVSSVERIIDSLLGGNSKLTNDASVVARLYYQRFYIQAIIKSPLWGYGLGSASYAQAFGELMGASHDNYLEMAYSYGIPVALGMYLFLLSLCFTNNAKTLTWYFRCNVPLLIFVCYFFYSFTINTVFDYRVFPVLASSLLMLLYFPVPLKSKCHV